MKKLGTPESHSDVINKHPSTLLIGYGWVGQFVHKYFTEADFYTPNTGLRYKDSNEIPKAVADERHWDIAFIGVPSPMQADGSCDLSYLESAVEQWHEKVKTFIIRSTITPGTTDRLQKKYPGNFFVMQPEYVGETLGHPLTEVTRDTFVILGGQPVATATAAEAWQRVLHPNSRIYQVSGKTAELCKYMENCFLATKVIFVNDFQRLADQMGVDFNQLREVWLADPRIGRSHSFAYRENPGFSGKCLPKDLNSIVNYARYVMNRPLELIESLLSINENMRKRPGVNTNEKIMPESDKHADTIRLGRIYPEHVWDEQRAKATADEEWDAQ